MPYALPGPPSHLRRSVGGHGRHARFDMSTTASIYAIATMDTKGDEIAYVAQCIRAAGGRVTVVDVGTKDAPIGRPDVDRDTIAGHHPQGASAVIGASDRGRAVTAMAEALRNYLVVEQKAGRL